VLGSLGLFAMVYGFAHAATKSGSGGWSDPQTIGSITAGIVLLVAFVDRSLAEITTDGAPACVELKGAS
jgi:hypothetical protein